MIYRQKNKSKHRFIKIVIFIFVSLFILRLFSNSLVVQIFNYPINYALDSSSRIMQPFKYSILYFKERDDLQVRIQELERKNLELQLNQILQQSNVQEFEYFLNTFGTGVPQTELFRVIERPPFSSFDIIRIVGELDPYKVGDFVHYKNIIIGAIVEKNNTYATVKLFSSPEQKTQIWIKGSQFEAIGLGGGRYFFEVAKDFEIEQKDIILFAEQQTSIVGVVELVESRSEDLFKNIYFNIPVGLSNISYVSIGNKQSSYEQQDPNTN